MKKKAKAATLVLSILGLIVVTLAGIQLYPLADEYYYTLRLDSDDYDVRESAMMKLREIGSASILPHLFRSMEKIDPDSVDREIVKIGWSTVRMPTMSHDERVASFLYLRYSRTLSEITKRSGEKVVPHLISALSAENAIISTMAAMHLGDMGVAASGALPALKKCTSSGDIILEYESAKAIKEIEWSALPDHSNQRWTEHFSELKTLEGFQYESSMLRTLLE